MLHCSNCFTAAKARRLLDYQPRYTSLEGVYEAVYWLQDQGPIWAYAKRQRAGSVRAVPALGPTTWLQRLAVVAGWGRGTATIRVLVRCC